MQGHQICSRNHCNANKALVGKYSPHNKITNKQVVRLCKLDEGMHIVQSGKMACKPKMNSKSQMKFRFSLVVLFFKTSS
jgi:hypothetical protein